MAKGLNIGDEVAITAKVRRRVTEDRVSVSIPSYGQPHSIVDRTSKVKQGQEIELRGDVTWVDEGKVTVNLGVPVTVIYSQAGNQPTRMTSLVDMTKLCDLRSPIVACATAKKFQLRAAVSHVPDLPPRRLIGAICGK
ncbi:hypothetical protein [Mesorhizobium sp. M1A.F.Ca.IN.022.04.1.1]|uniref:hypothetical protein n=1 Tax=unclassified Mesorhizobium TaxID=325217 RepID=UPI0032AFFE7E